MAEYVPPYRLSFLLPATLSGCVRPGPWYPCLKGCLLSIDDFGYARCGGQSREAVFRQVERFFQIVAKDMAAMTIAASLAGPEGRRDPWTITVNATVSFAPTGLGVDIPAR